MLKGHMVRERLGTSVLDGQSRQESLQYQQVIVMSYSRHQILSDTKLCGKKDAIISVWNTFLVITHEPLAVEREPRRRWTRIRMFILSQSKIYSFAFEILEKIIFFALFFCVLYSSYKFVDNLKNVFFSSNQSSQKTKFNQSANVFNEKS